MIPDLPEHVLRRRAAARRLAFIGLAGLASMGILVIRAARAPSVEQFDQRVWDMQMHWDRFVRAKWGCSKEAHNRSECNPNVAKLNRPEFRDSCEAAKALFDLKGDCD